MGVCGSEGGSGLGAVGGILPQGGLARERGTGWPGGSSMEGRSHPSWGVRPGGGLVWALGGGVDLHNYMCDQQHPPLKQSRSH